MPIRRLCLYVVAPNAFGVVFNDVILSISFRVFSVFRESERPVVRKKFRRITVSPIRALRNPRNHK
jgi:hypothetical protein